jgi:TrpR family transcriptional regulator, trp operon repressor
MLMTKESEKDGWRAFIELCSHSKKIEELKELFDLFFTLEEKENVAKRFSILKALLDKKLTQREIAEKLGVSISKITRGSNALKIISSHLREALKKKMA